MLTAIAAGVSIGSSLLGMASGLSANSDARDAAKKQSQLTYFQRQNEIRQIQKQQDQIVGGNVAKVFAGNLQMSGSPRNFVKQVQNDFSQELAFRRTAARLERDAIKSNAPGLGSDIGVVANGISNIGSSILGYNSAKGG